LVYAGGGTSRPWHIWGVDADGNNLEQLTNSPLDHWGRPDFSPDGTWVVYAKSDAEKGIWRVPIDGGESVRIIEANVGYFPVVSPNGKMIAYSYDDPNVKPLHGVAVIGFDSGVPLKRFDLPLQQANGPENPFQWATAPVAPFCMS
jgi:hypothetical protein